MLKVCNVSSNRKEIMSTPPDEGWVKINFDGASHGNPGPSSAGVVARDWKGNLIAFST